MKKTIGVIGGAGPEAGLLLAKKIFQECQREYGCLHDEDFPRLILLSVPFSQMLLPGREVSVSRELEEAMTFLVESGADTVAIACNTVHAFLGSAPRELVDLRTVTLSFLERENFQSVLVLCTSTSREKDLYNFEGRLYPSVEEQVMIDGTIMSVLGGEKGGLEKLLDLIGEWQGKVDAVLLGCTELSVLMDGSVGERVIDPVKLVAEKIVVDFY